MAVWFYALNGVFPKVLPIFLNSNFAIPTNSVCETQPGMWEYSFLDSLGAEDTF